MATQGVFDQPGLSFIPLETDDTQAVHLQTIPLHPSAFPAHPSLPPTIGDKSTEVRKSATSFLISLLDSTNACLYPDPLPRRSFNTTIKKKASSPPSSAPVELLRGEYMPGTGFVRETWIARRSLHLDAKEKGTASWEEFVDGLKRGHAEHEGEFTPTVEDVVKVLTWEFGSQDGELDVEAIEKAGWLEPEMAVYEMLHAMPSPLAPRAFPVLIASAFRKVTSPDAPTQTPSSFVTVSIPVNITKFALPASLYSTGRNVTDGKTPLQRKKVVLGHYAAVELVRKVAIGRKDERTVEGNEGGTIEWVMATASDAHGALPRWLQTMGVPGAVAKDVGLFLGWVEKKRGNSSES